MVDWKFFDLSGWGPAAPTGQVPIGSLLLLGVGRCIPWVFFVYWMVKLCV